MKILRMFCELCIRKKSDRSFLQPLPLGQIKHLQSHGFCNSINGQESDIKKPRNEYFIIFFKRKVIAFATGETYKTYHHLYSLAMPPSVIIH